MHFRQREIYWADLDPVRGREQRGRRPVLVISRNELNDLPLTVLVMPGTSAEHLDPRKNFPSDVWIPAREGGLSKDTVFLGLQLKSLDESRFGSRIGELPELRMREVWAAIRYVTGDDE